MTTYKALETLINNKAIRMDHAIEAIFDAYYNNRIDGHEHDKLFVLAEAKCPRD